MFLQPRTATYSAQDQLVRKILFSRQRLFFELLTRRQFPAVTRVQGAWKPR